MPTYRIKEILYIKPEAYIVWAMYILLLPIRWTAAWFIATLVHEFFHCIAIRLCGGSILHVRIGMDGAVIETNITAVWKECLSTLAGPLGGICTFLFTKQFPELAVCGFIQSAYNLLPIFPLDGGRAANCLIRMIFPDKIQKPAQKLFEWTALIILGVLGFYGTFQLSLGPIPVVLACILVLKNIRIKNLANNRNRRYNSATRK